jgi:hypothetical protein
MPIHDHEPTFRGAAFLWGGIGLGLLLLVILLTHGFGLLKRGDKGSSEASLMVRQGDKIIVPEGSALRSRLSVMAASRQAVSPKWGLTPVWGLSMRLPHRIGTAKAAEMMYTCRSYSGAEAEHMHLANFCFPDDRFDAELAALCADILSNSWYANQVNKRVLIETDGLSLHDSHALELFKNEGLAPDAAKRIAKFFSRQ